MHTYRCNSVDQQKRASTSTDVVPLYFPVKICPDQISPDWGKPSDLYEAHTGK